MSKKQASYSSLLVTVGILYLAVVAAQLGHVIPLAVLGCCCFLMARIIPGEFRRDAVAQEQAARRTWFEE